MVDYYGKPVKLTFNSLYYTGEQYPVIAEIITQCMAAGFAVKDTVNEVQRLKNHGIDVIGIFMGSAHDSELATKIFGRSLVKIKSINEFADAVGRVLNEILT